MLEIKSVAIGIQFRISFHFAFINSCEETITWGILLDAKPEIN